MAQVKTTFYAQVVPKFGQRYDSSKGGYVDVVEKITVTNVTQAKPNKPAPHAVVTKLTLEFDEAAFLPLQPSAVIQVPTNLTQMGNAVIADVEEADDGAVDFLARAAREAADG